MHTWDCSEALAFSTIKAEAHRYICYMPPHGFELRRERVINTMTAIRKVHAPIASRSTSRPDDEILAASNVGPSFVDILSEYDVSHRRDRGVLQIARRGD